ncbi:uncharacterized protein LOC133875811 [Alnus glutinosa]|uniref:uncharacterized protein LOC133875811 n=1 Tax=Alnus glutinosa TaxID=3517 RepID=UPI002D7A237F|nr:uncharacterized protein LOC133875811 [Alnus glutinosa]
MSYFPAKVMATLVALFLLVGGTHIPPTSALLPYGGRKSLSLDGSTKTILRLEGNSEGLNITSKKIVFFRSLRGGGSSPPPPPVRNWRYIPIYPPPKPKPPYMPKTPPPPPPPPPPQVP